MQVPAVAPSRRSRTARRRAATLGPRRVTVRANLPETIARELRRLITLGTFAPGLQLRQVDLAAHFGSSRVALREAFKLLSAEGIIDHDPHRGFFVAQLSLAEARQLYRMRRLLEAELLRTVEWPSTSQLAALTAQADVLEQALREQDTAAWLACHRAFFTSLFELSPQKVLLREVLRLIGLTDRYRAMAPQVLPSAQRRILQERHLLGALAKRNRRRLLELFERDRARIEAGVESVLRERGL